MIIEQLIFTIFAFGLFVYIFFKMIHQNDTNYIGILILESIGIALNFVSVITQKHLNEFFSIIKYIFGIIIPVGIIIMEKKGVPLIQILNILKAKIYLKIGNNKKAKEQLINLVTRYPENYIGHKMLAEIYELEGGMRKAIDEYVQAIDINKQDYHSYYKVAELLNNLEKTDEATQMLFNLLNKKPDYYDATALLGEILINKEMYKEAANVYQDALRYNPLSFEMNYNLGIVYTMLNDFQNAKIYYERAAEINSISYNSKYSLAEIALIYKELEEAERHFMEAIEDEELAADSYYELSKIAMIKGEKDKAIKFANIAIDIDSSKIVPKIKKDTIFIPIIARISIPFNIENIEEKESKLTNKELKSKEHLEEMFEKTRNLGYDDIKLLKSYRTEKHKEYIDKNENEREI